MIKTRPREKERGVKRKLTFYLWEIDTNALRQYKPASTQEGSRGGERGGQSQEKKRKELYSNTPSDIYPYLI